MITAIILAAGMSTRMGRENKLLLPYKSESILRHIILTLKKTKTQKIVTVLGHEADIVKRHIEDLNVETVVNPHYENGMCTSFQEGVRSLKKENVDGILLCLGDQPLVSEKSIEYLIDAYKADQTATKVFILSHNGKKGHPAILHPDTMDDILKIPIDGTIREVVHKYQTDHTKIETDDGVIKDIDTKEDFLKYCEN
ncbi:MAG: nucleotidyltransferase family protein [Deltaproteobacteria bacterium]|nr:nucleotidyltransferase family protein [Deltaproteobacteria bacterium]